MFRNNNSAPGPEQIRGEIALLEGQDEINQQPQFYQPDLNYGTYHDHIRGHNNPGLGLEQTHEVFASEPFAPFHHPDFHRRILQGVDDEGDFNPRRAIMGRVDDFDITQKVEAKGGATVITKEYAIVDENFVNGELGMREHAQRARAKGDYSYFEPFVDSPRDILHIWEYMPYDTDMKGRSGDWAYAGSLEGSSPHPEDMFCVSAIPIPGVEPQSDTYRYPSYFLDKVSYEFTKFESAYDKFNNPDGKEFRSLVEAVTNYVIDPTYDIEKDEKKSKTVRDFALSQIDTAEAFTVKPYDQILPGQPLNFFVRAYARLLELDSYKSEYGNSKNLEIAKQRVREEVVAGIAYTKHLSDFERYTKNEIERALKNLSQPSDFSGPVSALMERFRATALDNIDATTIKHIRTNLENPQITSDKRKLLENLMSYLNPARAGNREQNFYIRAVAAKLLQFSDLKPQSKPVGETGEIVGTSSGMHYDAAEGAYPEQMIESLLGASEQSENFRVTGGLAMAGVCAVFEVEIPEMTRDSRYNMYDENNMPVGPVNPRFMITSAKGMPWLVTKKIAEMHFGSIEKAATMRHDKIGKAPTRPRLSQIFAAAREQRYRLIQQSEGKKQMELRPEVLVNGDSFAILERSDGTLKTDFGRQKGQKHTALTRKFGDKRKKYNPIEKGELVYKQEEKRKQSFIREVSKSTSLTKAQAAERFIPSSKRVEIIFTNGGVRARGKIGDNVNLQFTYDKNSHSSGSTAR